MIFQEKHDALLAFCIGALKERGVPPDAAVTLNSEDTRKAIDVCEFKDADELNFFIRSLADSGLLKSYSTRAIVSFQITMAGYALAERDES